MERPDLTALYYELIHYASQIMREPGQDPSEQKRDDLMLKAITQLRQMIPIPPAPDVDEKTNMQALGENTRQVEENYQEQIAQLTKDYEDEIRELKMELHNVHAG